MNMSVSKDGSKIAYVLATYHDLEQKEDKKEVFPKEERTNIWVLDVKSKTSKQYTFGTVNTNPSWSPDGRTIAFISKRSDQKQIYLIPIDGGEAQQLTNLPLGAGSTPVWSPDGSQIAFSASSLEKKPDVNKPYRYKRDFYRFDGSGNVDHFRQDIYIITIATKEIKQITSDDKHHSDPRWSPDGSMLLWLTNFSSVGTDVFEPNFSIYKDDKVTTYLEEWGSSGLAEWVTNDSIVFQGIQKEKTIGSKEDIYLYNLQSNEIVCRSDGCLLGIGGSISTFIPGKEGRLNNLLVSENNVFTSVQNKGKISIYSFALTGEINHSEIVGGERVCYIQSVTNNLVIFTSSQANKPIDIYSFNIKTSQEDQLTFLNDEFLLTKLLPEELKIDIVCVDGVTTEGWFLLPHGKKPFKTLLKIHGGPHAGYGYAFQWDAQLLCGSGYAILMVNHRGSTGYGDKFATAINGDWGNLDYKDLMAGIDTGIKLGIIDENKMGCFGISGGGNLSSWIVGNTDRFKAAVPENPLTNWLSFYGVSDIGRYFSIREVGGLPHEIPEKYAKTSPITYAHNCKTPTLMIQHDNDLRCPVEQSEQFYAVLKEAGCVVEMLRMPGTPHGGSLAGPLEIREARSRALLDWFGKYV